MKNLKTLLSSHGIFSHTHVLTDVRQNAGYHRVIEAYEKLVEKHGEDVKHVRIGRLPNHEAAYLYFTGITAKELVDILDANSYNYIWNGKEHAAPCVYLDFDEYLEEVAHYQQLTQNMITYINEYPIHRRFSDEIEQALSHDRPETQYIALCDVYTLVTDVQKNRALSELANETNLPVDRLAKLVKDLDYGSRVFDDAIRAVRAHRAKLRLLFNAHRVVERNEWEAIDHVVNLLDEVVRTLLGKDSPLAKHVNKRAWAKEFVDEHKFGSLTVYTFRNPRA